MKNEGNNIYNNVSEWLESEENNLVYFKYFQQFNIPKFPNLTT